MRSLEREVGLCTRAPFSPPWGPGVMHRTGPATLFFAQSFHPWTSHLAAHHVLRACGALCGGRPLFVLKHSSPSPPSVFLTMFKSLLRTPFPSVTRAVSSGIGWTRAWSARSPPRTGGPWRPGATVATLRTTRTMPSFALTAWSGPTGRPTRLASRRRRLW